MAGRAFIGTSGWSYKHWGDGVFYPEGLSHSKWLPFFAERIKTVEINNSFYQMPLARTFLHWREITPSDFLFAVKANRQITHLRKLRNTRSVLKEFLSRSFGLKEKLGPVLFQLPPFLQVNVEVLAEFLKLLSQLVKGKKQWRCAFEFRHQSWFCDEVFDLLREHNASLCIADWPRMPVEAPVTADYVYLRRHGSQQLYSSCYTEEELRKDARRIRKWLREGKDVYVYFNNDAEGFAVKNCLRLTELVGG